MTPEVPLPDLTAQTVYVPLEELRAVLIRMLTKASMFEFDAKVAVQRMLDADLRGIPQHGAGRLLEFLEAINVGDIDPRGRVLTVIDKPAFAVLDGSRSLGAVAATKGMELAIAKARECGTGTVAVGNSQTLGAAGVYAVLAAQAGMLGFCCTSTGGATVTVPGTQAAGVGNNGFAWAIPTGEAIPLVIDLSCGTTSWAKVKLLQELGLPLPPGVAIDATGESTQQPETAARLRPAGGNIGFGMALACSVLAGPLAGGRMPNHKQKAVVSANDSEHFCYAIDLSQFTDPQRFQQEVGTTLAEIRQLPPQHSDQPVRLPGDRSAAALLTSQALGVPLLKSAAKKIRERAVKLKIDVPWNDE